MMKRQAFVVVPINYEYNDEYYFEQGYEIPTAVYFDLAKAKAAVVELSRTALQGIDLNSYNEDVRDTIKDEEVLLSYLEELTGERPNLESITLPSALTIAQAEKLLSLIMLEFYCIETLMVEA